jgi:hypothetical protein
MTLVEQITNLCEELDPEHPEEVLFRICGQRDISLVDEDLLEGVVWELKDEYDSMMELREEDE